MRRLTLEEQFVHDAVTGFLDYGNIGYLKRLGLRRHIAIIRPAQEWAKRKAIEAISLVLLDIDRLSEQAGGDPGEAIRLAAAEMVARIENFPLAEEPDD